MYRVDTDFWLDSKHTKRAQHTIYLPELPRIGEHLDFSHLCPEELQGRYLVECVERRLQLNDTNRFTKPTFECKEVWMVLLYIGPTRKPQQ